MTRFFFVVCRKPPTYKSVIQANGSTKKKSKEEKPPDLWINHTENLDMKPVQTVDPAPDVTNITASIPRYIVLRSLNCVLNPLFLPLSLVGGGGGGDSIDGSFTEDCDTDF